MDLELCTVIIFAIAIVALCFVFCDYAKKHPTLQQLAEAVRTKTYELFLFAQKQDWINEDKMAYVVEQLFTNWPIKFTVDKKTVKAIAQFLYDEYKEIVKKGLEPKKES